MRDGVRLATDVYLPHQDYPGPTILIRAPYDKSSHYVNLPAFAEPFVAHGYRVVTQDVRGKYRSEGETLAFVNEAYDGYDTIDWIVRQPWSDERVAMFGDSYYGFTQWAALSTAHPALKAVVPGMTGMDSGELPAFMTGASTCAVEERWQRQYHARHFTARESMFVDIDLERRPLIADWLEAFDEIGARSTGFDAQLFGAPALRRFPNGRPTDAPPIPILIDIGYWDSCAHSSWSDYYELLIRPEWRPLLHLRAAATDHDRNRIEDSVGRSILFRNGESGQYTPEEWAQVIPRSVDHAMAFFNHYLRGGDTEIKRVEWELTHVGFRTDDAWPPDGTQEVTFYLSGGDGDDGVLTPLVPPEDLAPSVIVWDHDPSNLVPSAIAEWSPFSFLRSYPDESPIGEREDVLSFVSSSMETPLDLAGPAYFNGVFVSTASTTDLFARLLDEDDSGAARLVTRGQVRLRESDRKQCVRIRLNDVGYRLRVGHRLRLHVTSSDYPEFVPNPGNDEHPWFATNPKRAVQRLFVGGDQPATLSLTVLSR